MARVLTEQEISVLRKNGCSAENWQNIQVTGDFNPERLLNVRFMGEITLGANTGSLNINGVAYPSGIYNAVLNNTSVADNAVIQNIGFSISNYQIEEAAAIINVAEMTAIPDTTFGQGTEVESLNEAGGREVPIFSGLSSQTACLMTLFRYRPGFSEKLKILVQKEMDKYRGRKGVVGKGAKILDCGVIRNVMVGPFTQIKGTASLKNGTIESCAEDPVIIGNGVSAESFIILAGAHVTDKALLSKVFVGQGAHIGKQFSAENSLFFANAEGFHGEACSIYAGPYTVTHHKSTLLIAAMYSFFNAGSGTNHSNHMYKLGPVHQGILERGCKTGSFSYLLLECHLAPFCIVIGKHMTNINLPDLPFSYFTEREGKTYITPAMNLVTVGTVRDQDKWASRDRRKSPVKQDIINAAIYSPFTIEKMRRGRDLLLKLHQETPKDNDSVNLGGVVLKRLLMKNGAKYYNMTIKRYLYQQFFVRLEEKLDQGGTWQEALEAVVPQGLSSLNWADLSGLLCPIERVHDLIDRVESGDIQDVQTLQETLEKYHRNYHADEWAYASAAFENEFGKNLKALEKEDALSMIADWHKITGKISRLILADAGREFEPSAQIGYGLYGTAEEVAVDFKSVRGTKESNKVLLKIQDDLTQFNQGVEKLKSMINSAG